jgi:hypothetical protein
VTKAGDCGLKKDILTVAPQAPTRSVFRAFLRNRSGAGPIRIPADRRCFSKKAGTTNPGHVACATTLKAAARNALYRVVVCGSVDL